jgi:hypothetical protein
LRHFHVFDKKIANCSTSLVFFAFLTSADLTFNPLFNFLLSF